MVVDITTEKCERNNPNFCFTILKKEWVEMGGARRQAVYQIERPAFGGGVLELLVRGVPQTPQTIQAVAVTFACPPEFV